MRMTWFALSFFALVACGGSVQTAGQHHEEASGGGHSTDDPSDPNDTDDPDGPGFSEPGSGNCDVAICGFSMTIAAGALPQASQLPATLHACVSGHCVDAA